ncbi:MAG: aspartate-semialdehyde dehydrogenase [Gammaproteobacteria bacterium]|nr:aspartate-semialdehyde dehydrogenase [Gammaproteobacteria bacterium]
MRVVIVGATGVVGQTMLKILAQRQFPVAELFLLASERSAGQVISFNQQMITLQDLAHFDFAQADLALFSAGAEISKYYAPKAAQANCMVIDNTSYFRQDEDVPLIIPEVNGNVINKSYRPPRNIIANPNCSTIQMLVALKPIYDAVGIKRINVCTYQAVSGSGKQAIDELQQQTITAGTSSKVYAKPIAFNVLPHIDTFQSNGYTREEMKMIWETQKILNDQQITINPTAVRVPVVNGHSEALHIETTDKITAAQAKQLLRHAPGITLIDDNHDYPTALTHADGQDAVFVGRIREDISHPRGLNLWVVADNLRKGAALNSIQIAECLLLSHK